MSRRTIALLITLSMPLFVALPSAFGSTSGPVLGWKGAFLHGKGFGNAKPSTVFLGGDPTGRVTSITWHDWGHSQAVGYGTGWCPGESVAAGHSCAAALHVSDVGTCHGRRAYERLGFSFKMGGRWTSGSKWNICSGQA